MKTKVLIISKTETNGLIAVQAVMGDTFDSQHEMLKVVNRCLQIELEKERRPIYLLDLADFIKGMNSSYNYSGAYVAYVNIKD